MRIAACLAVVLFAAPSFAQEAPLTKVYACADIADGAARLACFDGAVASLKQAQASGGVAVVSRAQIEKAEKEAFGLPTPSLSELARSTAAAASPVANSTAAATAPAPAPQALDNIILTITSLKKLPNGTYRFTMDNGQVWQQIDTYDLGTLTKTPMTAEIRKASVGSFMLKAGGRTAVRVRRIE